MSKIVVLGGCGAVGSIAVKTLTQLDDFSEVVIGDIDLKKAKNLVSQIGTVLKVGSQKLSAIKVNALDPNSVKNAIKDADIVLNTTGPFYKIVPVLLKEVIESGINYVDICDDVDVTKDILDMNEKAKNAGITALIGMGSSPGVTNLLAKFAANILDETDSIDMYHIHGGEPTEGAGVIGHRIHSMVIPIPVFLDGKLKTVKSFTPEAMMLEEEVEFHEIGTYRVFPYPHPEIITLPRYIEGLKRVTNKGTVLPEEYYSLTRKMVKLGLISEEPIDVKGQKISPYDFTIAYIINQRKKILKETNFGKQRGCVKIVVSGKRKGKPLTYVFQIFSTGRAMGEGTGIPAAFGAALVQRGKIKIKGVVPPEGSVSPVDFLLLMQKFFKLEKASGKGSPLLIQTIDEEGNVKKIDI
ncbi:MAG: saccharopine dehydrogenase family protein [Candidatus Helarchaeota archaeon]